MPTGDYVSGNSAVERKAFSDYVNSVTGAERRVFNQAERLAFEFQHACVVVVGSKDQFHKEMIKLGKRIRFPNSNFFGSICSLMTDEDKGVQCWHVENQNQFFEFTYYFLRRGNEVKRDHEKVKLAPPVSKDVHISQIACISKIGKKTAYDIAQIFKTPRELCDATVEDLMTVDRIGRNTALRIKKWYK
jgi:ERCC4-type nuclease